WLKRRAGDQAGGDVRPLSARSATPEINIRRPVRLGPDRREHTHTLASSGRLSLGEAGLTRTARKPTDRDDRLPTNRRLGLQGEHPYQRILIVVIVWLVCP